MMQRSPPTHHMQEEVHAATTAPLIDFVVSGFNATVFAYGATGAGKTYTMIGTKENPGLMTLLTKSLYEKINPDEYTVYLSYLEVYNEVIRDLLNPSAGFLELLEDDKGNVQVPGLSRVKAPNTSKIVRNRPASADQVYSEAMREMQRENQRRATLTQTSSSHQIHDKSLGENKANGGAFSKGGIVFNSQIRIKSNPKKFSSLFNSLKEQYLTIIEKQNKLRERLLKANHEAYDVEMSRTSKMAILNAWEKHKQSVIESDVKKSSESVERLKAEVAELESRLSQLTETRRKVEKAIRKGVETTRSVEGRLRVAAKDAEQNEVVDLLVKMATSDAEKIAITSDSVLQNLRMRKQESSLLKVMRYELVADKLIDGNLNEDDRERLQQEYRVLKNQVHYHMIPLKQTEPVVSWNTQLLQRSGVLPSANKPKSENGLDRTYAATDMQLLQTRTKREVLRLPAIAAKSLVDSSETQSDSGSETLTTRLPAINVTSR
ncbi:hypothetical protein QR680_001793 [Steinernema hermaphroditum]|uniref:Kinesin motor domain-containing protein n=1 Tax=Steinernema hermaphroditum TaxID=289476 RepID=A0AA39H0Q7_9BILA|nr:hypothetical protein QR680_001793 [Steinernema hermaphroditum]